MKKKRAKTEFRFLTQFRAKMNVDDTVTLSPVFKNTSPEKSEIISSY